MMLVGHYTKQFEEIILYTKPVFFYLISTDSLCLLQFLNLKIHDINDYLMHMHKVVHLSVYPDLEI